MTWVTDANPFLLYGSVAALYATTFVSGVLPVVYHVETSGRWIETSVGRHLMSVSICLFLMLLGTSVAPLIADVNILLGISFVLYATLGALQVNQMRLIIRAQRARETEEYPDDG